MTLISAVILITMLFTGCSNRTGAQNSKKNGAETSMGGESSVTLNEEEQELADLINAERQNGGLEPLEFTSKLNECALLKANDMTENNYFSHMSPTHGSPFDMMKTQGVRFEEAAENIVGAATADEAINRWMNDKNQRANIMNGSFAHGGLAISESPIYGKIMVLLAISNS